MTRRRARRRCTTAESILILPREYSTVTSSNTKTSVTTRREALCSDWSDRGYLVHRGLHLAERPTADYLSQAGEQEGTRCLPSNDHVKRLAPTGRVDWDRVDATTEEEIARQIAEDPETAPEITDEALERAVVVSSDGSRTPYPERVAGLRAVQCLRPGTKAPMSGIYEIIGPSGEKTGAKRTAVRGEPLPPTPASGQHYRPASSIKRQRGS